MAERPGVSEMPQAYGIRSNASVVSVRPLSATNLGDGRNDVSQKPHTPPEMVLGDVLDGCDTEGGFYAKSSKTFGDRILRDGLAYGT